MLRISGVSDLDVDASRPPEDQAIEVFCNKIAAATLMPQSWILNDERVIRHGLISTKWSNAEIAGMARMFGVNREALIRRLLTFGRTTEEFYNAKRHQYAAEYQANRQRDREKVAKGGIPRNMSRATLSAFGSPLVHMILGNYYRDRLTLSEVAGYLGLKTKHIAKLEHMIGLR